MVARGRRGSGGPQAGVTPAPPTTVSILSVSILIERRVDTCAVGCYNSLDRESSHATRRAVSAALDDTRPSNRSETGNMRERERESFDMRVSKRTRASRYLDAGERGKALASPEPSPSSDEEEAVSEPPRRESSFHEDDDEYLRSPNSRQNSPGTQHSTGLGTRLLCRRRRRRLRSFRNARAPSHTSRDPAGATTYPARRRQAQRPSVARAKMIRPAKARALEATPFSESPLTQRAGFRIVSFSHKRFSLSLHDWREGARHTLSHTLREKTMT